MSKVKGGGSKRTRRTSKTRSAAVSAPRRLRNWAEAQVRGARYRVANAARLGAIAGACLLGAMIGGLALFGQLDDVADMTLEYVEAELVQAGFAVDSVDVTGATGAVARQIVLETGLEDGQSLFAVDPEVVRQRVEALSVVRTASVVRLWPNRVAVVVETREAFALWQVDGQLNVIDRYGVVMAEADAMDPPDLPLVVAEGANETVVEIVDALDAFPSVAQRVVGAVRVGERRWNLRLNSGADIKLPEGDVQASLAVLARLHAERGVLGLSAEVFDLRGEGDLIVRILPERAAAMREA